MRYLISLSVLFTALLLSACSTSDGEDQPFFDRSPPLVQLVVQQCQLTPENTQPFSILNAGFGIQATPETGDPATSNFANSCITNTP